MVHTDCTPVSYRHWWCSERICHDVARCNHYRYRSYEDWVARCERMNCNDAAVKHKDSLGGWEQGGNWQIADLSALRFADQVKNVLGR